MLRQFWAILCDEVNRALFVMIIIVYMLKSVFKIIRFVIHKMNNIVSASLNKKELIRKKKPF